MPFLIKNNRTGEYLYFNDTLLSKDYRFKKIIPGQSKKLGASVLDKHKKNRVLKHLRENGFDVSAKVVKWPSK